MQRFALPLFIALTALVIGIVIGRSTVAPAKISSSRTDNSSSTETTTSNPANSPAVPSRDVVVAPDSQTAVAISSESIIFKIKAALGHSGSRRTYATFSKLADTVDAKNVREVLAFVQTLPKPQEKSMLISLFVGRWAELDPQAAIAYAQTLPAGSVRNWAITSAVGGWAEHDTAAATAWASTGPSATKTSRRTTTRSNR